MPDEIVGVMEHHAHGTRGVARIAAALLLRRRLEHGDRGALLARRQGRARRRIARAHHQHIDVEIVHFATPFGLLDFGPLLAVEYRNG